MLKKIAAALLLLMPASAYAAPQCVVEHARYVSMSDPQWSAGFQLVPQNPGWVTNVAFAIRSAATNRTYWFLFDAGSAKSVNMISTVDVTRPGWHPPAPDGPSSERPLGEMHYLPADSQFAFSLTLPKPGRPAPAYILLPDLPEVMWYRADVAAREAAPLAFFKLSGCD
jgi:hypothetical protein